MKNKFDEQRKLKFKIVLSIVLVIAAVLVVWGVRHLVKYTFYDKYKDYLTDYEVAEGTEFKAISESTSSVADSDSSMVLVSENDNLKLYASVTTGNIAIYDKRTGETVFSNPVDADNDAIANETNKNYLKSQIIVDYYNTERLESSFDSYTYCTSIDQLEVESIENGIRFIYTIGDMSGETGIVPEYISTETLEKVLAALDEDSAKFVKKKYTESDIGDGFLELLDSAKKGASQLRKLNKYFEEAGFTAEDYNNELIASGVEGAIPIYFVIPVEYTLLDDSVEVNIPMKSVEEYGGGAIHKIQLLRYMAAGSDTEDGYMLVPNGSGSIINFNNGKGTLVDGNDYSEYVYGIDPLAAEYTVKEITEDCRMALFGLFRNNEAVFATIEDSASFANITANVAGEVNSYNYVYPTFVLRGDDKLSMFGSTGSEADLPIVETNFYDSNLTVRYTMLGGSDASYSGAANYYRQRLIDEGVLALATETDENIKFYYDILGGVERTKYFLGTQYRGLYAMTTFDQASEIATDLNQMGVESQVMNYQGWTAGGYYADVLDKLRIPSSLGGKKDLEQLNEDMQELNSYLYADAAFQKVSTVSSRYSSSSESSRYYGTGYVAEFGLVNPTSLRQTSGLGYEENVFYLISPKFLVRYASAFNKKISNLDIQGISLRDLANELHSDKRRSNVINREQALDIVTSQLELLDSSDKNLMLDDANDYSWGYAQDIINAPTTDNDYYIVDETVPFYEMIIHGCIDYAGDTINLNDTTDEMEIVLNLVEAGASPHFMFTYENSNELKETGINRFYSTTYENWKDMAVSIYSQVNEALSEVSGSYITEHAVCESGAVKVTYSNGKTIYINKNTYDVTEDGINIPARSYTVQE